jgi:hypothetical protein
MTTTEDLARTADALGGAVADVAATAIRQEWQPFTAQLRAAGAQLERSAAEVGAHVDTLAGEFTTLRAAITGLRAEVHQLAEAQSRSAARTRAFLTVLTGLAALTVLGLVAVAVLVLR